MPKVGGVIWICGLSGAGKSTVSRRLQEALSRQIEGTVLLDGDMMRSLFIGLNQKNDQFSREARIFYGKKYSELSFLLATQGCLVIVATISLFEEILIWNRENLPNYFEVFLKVPIDELKRRDPKGLYTRFYRGETKNVAGLDIEIDEPLMADLTLKYDPQMTADDQARFILQNYLSRKKT